MKEQVQLTGVRKWFGDDYINLQNELRDSFTGFLTKYGSCVLSGCEVSGNEFGEYTISDGFAFLLDSNGQNGKICRVYAQTFLESEMPIYLIQASRDKTDVPAYGRNYKDGNNKNIIIEYYGDLTTTHPVHANYLSFNTGSVNKTFRDVLQDSLHRFVSDTEKSTWNGKAAGSHVHAQSDITGLVTALAAKLATADLLTAIKAVDGSGSGIDADTVDGFNFMVSLGMHPLSLTPSPLYFEVGGNYHQILTDNEYNEFQQASECVSTNTASHVVKRDASGNFAAGTITVTDVIIA